MPDSTCSVCLEILSPASTGRQGGYRAQFCRIRHRSGEFCRSVYFFFFLSTCVSAEAAAVLAAFEDFGLLKTLPAADAAFLPVDSFFPMNIYSIKSSVHGHQTDRSGATSRRIDSARNKSPTSDS